MTSDEKRREVAERLRILASHAPADKDYVLDALGLYPGEYIDGFDPYCVNELAELIDRPTCWDTGDGWTFRCSACGCELDIEDREGEPTMWDGGSATTPRYCPSCGALVWRLTRDDD